MKYLIPILVLLGSCFGAAPTIVQKSPSSCFATGASTITCTLTSNVTAGNMLLGCIGVGANGTISVSTPTMTGETLTKVTGMSSANNTNANGQIQCYATNSAVGGHNAFVSTITGGTADIHVHVVEMSGQAASPQDATGAVAASATLSVSTSGSTTTANDLVLGFFYDNATNRTFSAGSGYVTVQQTNNTTGGDAMYSESETVSATGTQTATASGNSTDSVVQGIIAIAGTAGGAAKVCTMTMMGMGPC